MMVEVGRWRGRGGVTGRAGMGALRSGGGGECAGGEEETLGLAANEILRCGLMKSLLSSVEGLAALVVAIVAEGNQVEGGGGRAGPGVSPPSNNLISALGRFFFITSTSFSSSVFFLTFLNPSLPTLKIEPATLTLLLLSLACPRST